MNKKAALSVGAIVVVVLGLLVILLIVTGPLKVGYEYAKEKFFGEKSIFAPIRPSFEEEFVPYTDSVSLSPEEKIVDDSVKAFVCAANSLGLQKLGWAEGICPDGFEEKAGCDGVAYGQSCVTCPGPEGAKFCLVRDFELPQTVSSSIPLVRFAREFMARYNDPKYLVYYESFPRGEETAWQINPGSFWMDVVLFGSGMSLVPVVGSYGRGALAAGKGVVSKTFYKIIGKEAKVAAKESSEVLIKRTSIELGKELSEKALRQMVNVFDEKGIDRLLRSERLYTSLLDGFKEVGEETTEEIRESVLLRYYYHTTKRGVKDPEKLISRIRADVYEGVPKPSGFFKHAENQKLLDDAIEAFVKKPLSEAEQTILQKQQATKQFFVKYLLKESGEGLNKEVLDQLFTKVVSKELFEELGEEASEQLMKKAAGYADEIVDLTSPGADIFKIKGFSSTVKADFNKLADEMLKVPENTQALQRFLAGVTAGEVSEAISKKGGYWATAKAGALRYNPIYWKAKGKIIPISRPTLLGTIFYKAPVGGSKLAKDAAYVTMWRPRASRYILAYIIGLSIAQADATNEKYAFRGGDAIVLQKPYMYEKNRVYDLDKSTSEYYLNLYKFKDNKKGNSRFFMVSPCKTDLMLVQTKCSCEIGNNEFLLDYTLQPVQKESVKPAAEDYLDPTHMFDRLGKVAEQKYKDDEEWDKEKFQKTMALKCLGNSEFSKVCALTVAKHPEAYDKFLHYVYDNVYVASINFLKENDLSKYLNNKEVSASLYTLGTNINMGRDSALKNFRTDSNFPGFYVLSGQGMTPAGSSAARVIMVPTIMDGSSFRTEPLDFVDFTVAFEEKLYHAWWDDPIKNIYSSMNFANGVLDKPFPDLFDSNNFLGVAANNTFLHYNVIRYDKADVSRVAKTCRITGDKKSDDAFEIVEDNLMTARVSVPCFNIIADLNDNYGKNYCFSGDHSYIENAKWVATGIAVAIDIAVGITGVGFFIEAPVVLFTGTTAAWIGHELDKDQWWPNH